MKPIHLTTRSVVALLLLLATGCSTITPQTASLKNVNETYQREFAALLLPTPDDVKGTSGRQANAAFAETLAAIREASRHFQTNSAESAHLTVLEGMIYLQTGRIGMAHAMEDGVAQANTLLTSASGRYVRDQLFAASYAPLVQGWDAILFYQDRLKSAPPGQTPEQRRAAEASVATLWRSLTNAAMRLERNLSELNSIRLPDGEADQGAIYLANCGAIFFAWAVQLYPDASTLEAVRADWLKRGRNLIGRFLTENEKRVAEEEKRWLNQDRPANLPERSPDPKMFSEGRWRYVRWYQWLKDNENVPLNSP